MVMDSMPYDEIATASHTAILCRKLWMILPLLHAITTLNTLLWIKKLKVWTNYGAPANRMMAIERAHSNPSSPQALNDSTFVARNHHLEEASLDQQFTSLEQLWISHKLYDGNRMRTQSLCSQ